MYNKCKIYEGNNERKKFFTDEIYYIKMICLIKWTQKNKSVETIGNIGLEKKIKKLPTFTWHKLLHYFYCN